MLEDLIKVIRERKKSNTDNSYTKQLISSGLPKCVDKLQEEFDELKELYSDIKSLPAKRSISSIVSLEVADIKI